MYSEYLNLSVTKSQYYFYINNINEFSFWNELLICRSIQKYNKKYTQEKLNIINNMNYQCKQIEINILKKSINKDYKLIYKIIRKYNKYTLDDDIYIPRMLKKHISNLLIKLYINEKFIILNSKPNSLLNLSKIVIINNKNINISILPNIIEKEINNLSALNNLYHSYICQLAFEFNPKYMMNIINTICNDEILILNNQLYNLIIQYILIDIF